MLLFQSRAFKLAAALVAFVLMTVINVFICFGVASAVMFQALASDINKYCSLGLAILVAIATSLFIRWNHKIWEFIKKQGTKDNE